MSLFIGPVREKSAESSRVYVFHPIYSKFNLRLLLYNITSIISGVEKSENELIYVYTFGKCF